MKACKTVVNLEKDIRRNQGADEGRFTGFQPLENTVSLEQLLSSQLNLVSTGEDKMFGTLSTNCSPPSYLLGFKF